MSHGVSPRNSGKVNLVDDQRAHRGEEEQPAQAPGQPLPDQIGVDQAVVGRGRRLHPEREYRGSTAGPAFVVRPRFVVRLVGPIESTPASGSRARDAGGLTNTIATPLDPVPAAPRRLLSGDSASRGGVVAESGQEATMAVQTTRTVEELEAYCARLRAAGLDAPWSRPGPLIPPKPTATQARHWRWRDIEPLLFESSEYLSPASRRGASRASPPQPRCPGADRRPQSRPRHPVPAARRGRARAPALADRDQVHAPRRRRLHHGRRPEVRHEARRPRAHPGDGLARPRQRGRRARLLDGHPRLADRPLPREPDVRAVSGRAAARAPEPGPRHLFPVDRGLRGPPEARSARQPIPSTTSCSNTSIRRAAPRSAPRSRATCSSSGRASGPAPTARRAVPSIAWCRGEASRPSTTRPSRGSRATSSSSRLSARHAHANLGAEPAVLFTAQDVPLLKALRLYRMEPAD